MEGPRPPLPLAPLSPLPLLSPFPSARLTVVSRSWYVGPPNSTAFSAASFVANLMNPNPLKVPVSRSVTHSMTVMELAIDF